MTIPTAVRTAIEGVLDKITGEECIPFVTRLTYGGYIWKVSITKSQENEISILVRRQKR